MATVRFLLEGGAVVTKTYPLTPQSRLTVYAGGIPELVNQAFGTVVTFNDRRRGGTRDVLRNADLQRRPRDRAA